MLTRLTTATPWQQVPTSPLADGIYQGILRSAQVTFVPPAGQDQPPGPGLSGERPSLPTSAGHR